VSQIQSFTFARWNLLKIRYTCVCSEELDASEWLRRKLNTRFPHNWLYKAIDRWTYNFTLLFHKQAGEGAAEPTKALLPALDWGPSWWVAHWEATPLRTASTSSCLQEPISTDWKSVMWLDGVSGGPSKPAYETRVVNKKSQLKCSLPRTGLHKTWL
jgi:hypothetical protein